MPTDTFNPVATAVALVTAAAGGDTQLDAEMITDLERAQALQVIACLTGMLTANVQHLSEMLGMPLDKVLARMGVHAALDDPLTPPT